MLKSLFSPLRLLKPRRVVLYFGIYQIGSLLHQPLKGIHDYFVYEQEDLFKKYGGCAVVTGGSDGVGRKYVEQLLKMGFKVIIVSRSMQKMQSVKQELGSANIELIEFDFQETNYEKLF